MTLMKKNRGMPHTGILSPYFYKNNVSLSPSLLFSLLLSQLYKHVVQIVEKFIKKVIQISLYSVLIKHKWSRLWLFHLLSSFQCKPEYKVAGLYVVDSIVRQSRHQFGADKDVFGPRFTKNIVGTFENLCLCPVEDRVRTAVEISVSVVTMVELSNADSLLQFPLLHFMFFFFPE